MLDGTTEKPKPASAVTVSVVMLDWWETRLKRYGVDDLQTAT